MKQYKRPQRDRLPLDIANFNDQELGAIKTTEPRTNVFGSAWLSLLDAGKELPFPRWGQIVDFVPLHNAYRVQAENGVIHICTFGSTTGHQLYGVRQGNTLPLGTNVVFLPPVQGHYGMILCVDPGYVTDGRNLRNDYVVQGGRTGLHAEKAHDALLTRLQFQGGNPCFNGGRPFDSTSAGELNYMTETGLGLHMDSFLAYLRVDEATGLFLFYHDQLMRLAGHNLQLRSAVGEREELDDQQEAVSFAGYSPYRHESMGAWAWCQDNHREVSSSEVQSTKQEYSLLEPKFDDQQPFNRVLEFGGYLGQAWKKMVVLPPSPLPSSPNRYSQQQKYIGIYNEQVGLDGSYLLQGRRIGIFKSCAIPVPKMMIRPEDERGDNETNYKAAGLFGPAGGEAHKIAGQFSDNTAARELVNAASVLDMAAFLSNWAGVHPFFYHRRDWYLPEICEGTLSVVHQPIAFCGLKTVQNLTAPSATVLNVDHRTTAHYFANEAYLVFLEDGGMVFSDGFGSEIRSTAGSMDICVPGDLNIRAGRSINLWAGWDVNVKANNSADIVANRGDVRLKAEHNLQMLSGNDGKGGTLIENRATCAAYDFSQLGQGAKHTGIMLVSEKAPISSYGSDVILKAVPNSTQPGSGNVVVDTTKDIKFYGGNILSYMNSRIDFFNNTTVTNEYWPQHTLIGGSLRVKEKTYLSGSLVVGDWISVINGHVATTMADSDTYKGMVAKVANEAAANTELTATTNRASYLEALKPTLNRPGYEGSVITGTTGSKFFSMRLTADYKTSGYKFFESRWQQQARLTNSVPDYWTENPVQSNGTDTYAYPGADVILGNSWCTQDLTLFSAQLGSPIDRESNQTAYEDAKFGATNVTVLNGRYPIISNC